MWDLTVAQARACLRVAEAHPAATKPTTTLRRPTPSPDWVSAASAAPAAHPTGTSYLDCAITKPTLVMTCVIVSLINLFVRKSMYLFVGTQHTPLWNMPHPAQNYLRTRFCTLPTFQSLPLSRMSALRSSCNAQALKYSQRNGAHEKWRWHLDKY